MKILAYNNQALSINGKGVYIEDLSALAENGSLIKIVTPIVNKGDLVYLDVDGKGEKLYRVLKCKGDVAMVMAMYDDLTSKWNETNTTTTMGTLTVRKYEGSTLDIYLNTTWYGTLSTETKNAIVTESLICDAWFENDTGNPNYTGTWGTSVPGDTNYTISKYAGGTLNIGNRNVFALGIQDVIDYLSDDSVKVDTSAILRNVNIWKMFWNDEAGHSGKVAWLRSSYADSSSYVWAAGGPTGNLGHISPSTNFVVRPAFNINLSQVPFTVYRLPAKGDIVKLNLDGTEREYRVLSMNGSVGKIVGMWDSLISKYNETNTTTTMGTLTVQKYEDSTLDTYLNITWYNTLSNTAKAAIVPERVVCDTWYKNDNGNPGYTGTYGTDIPGTNSYTISKYAGGTLNIGNRNVFALSVQDVIDYLSDDNVKVDTSAILRNVNIWKMFWNDEISHSSNFWLRSSSGEYSDNAWYAGNYNGNLGWIKATNSMYVRPALNLDFSKISSTLT